MRNITQLIPHDVLFLSGTCDVKVISMDSTYVPETNDDNGEDEGVDVSSDELGMSLAEDESEAARLMKAKPHLCSHDGCGKRFDRPSLLKRHERIHTGKKPHLCSHDGCGYRSAQAGNLKKHERTHTDEKPYMCSCEGCGYRSTSASNVNRHCKKHHTDDTSAGWIRVPASTSLPSSPPASASSPATAPTSRKRKRAISTVTPTSSSAASPRESKPKKKKKRKKKKRNKSKPAAPEVKAVVPLSTPYPWVRPAGAPPPLPPDPAIDLWMYQEFGLILEC